MNAAKLAQVLALNHEPEAAYRDRLLDEFARKNFPQTPDLEWFELTGAASAWLTILALFALATDPALAREDAEATYNSYLPWVCLAGTMLDSYADRVEDEENHSHSYIAHYATTHCALERMEQVLGRAFESLAQLPRGERHIVVASCMVAMFLSKDDALAPCSRYETRRLARVAGPLSSKLVPALRTWRVIYGQRSDGNSHRQLAVRGRLPKAVPLPSAMQTFAVVRDPHGYLASCRDRYGPTFTIRCVGLEPLVFVSAWDGIRRVITAPPDVLNPGAGASVIAPLVGDGSFMLADGEDHLRGRRAVLPAFHHARIQRHADMLESIAAAEVERWPREKVVALHPYLRSLSLRVILRTVFGREHRLHRELHQQLLSMLSITSSLALQEVPLRRVPPWRGLWRRFLRDRAAVDALLYRAIEETVAEESEDGLIARLSRAAESPTQVRDDLMSVIVAGHETTASQLTWAFQLLAHNRRAARRLIEDVDSGDGSYILATVKEVLRYRSVFLFAIPRIVREPFEVQGWTVSPPAQLLGCIHLLHHDPQAYEAPDEFRPERFLADEQPDVWMPWGGGRKRCPGSHLALLEMQTVLKTVFSRFSVAPASNAIERAQWRSVIVTPAYGGRVILKERRMASASGGPPFFDDRL